MEKYMFVIPSLSIGGAERAVSNFANELVRQNRKVVVLKYFDTEHDYAVSKGVRVINLSGGTEIDYNRISYFQKIVKIRRCLKEECPDFILPFLPQVTIHVTLAGYDLRKKIIHTIRNNPKDSPHNRCMRLMRNCIVFFSHKTIVQTEQQRDYFPKIIHKKIHILRNIVPDIFFQKKREPSREKNLLVSVGRLIEQKNYEMLIKALAIVDKTYSDFKMEIYGNGPLKHDLEVLIKDTGLEDKIRLMGRNDKIHEVYQRASLYILSSDFEGMPNSLMEAMASGVPCISTNCPTGPNDLIENNRTGLLVPVGDTSAMAEAILWMLTHTDESKEMGTKASEYIEKQCKGDKIAKQIIEICED